MKHKGTQNAKINTWTALLDQLAATLCGILVPRMMLGAFGSALYGAVTSIGQFLSCMALFEGGIGRTARAALYHPLAEGDSLGVSRIYHGVKRFFLWVGVGFCIYTLVLALSYYDIAGVTALDRGETAALVAVISLAAMADYFLGITNMTLIHADQKKYLINLALTVTRIVNTVLVALMIAAGSDILAVKLGGALVAVCRPVFFSAYVKRHYALPKVAKQEAALQHKWDGLGQHMAYFLHTNTDMVLLTVFADLETVAVYAVYSMVILSIRNITAAFAGGMEAELGSIFARGQDAQLRRTYRKYQNRMGTVTTVLFGTTAAMIVPFVRLYTQGITDADYIQPGFALLLILAEAIHCVSLPASTVPVAANALRRTRWGAFGEAGVNVGLSCILMLFDPLLGVAAGTLCAELFKSIYYTCYAEKHILKNGSGKALLRLGVTVAVLTGLCLGAMLLTRKIPMTHFGEWALWAAGAVVIMALMAAVTQGALYRELWLPGTGFGKGKEE